MCLASCPWAPLSTYNTCLRIEYTSIHIGKAALFYRGSCIASPLQIDAPDSSSPFGHDQRIGPGDIRCVCCSKAGNCMNPSARADIKNFDGLVILCDKNEAVTLRSAAKMFKIAYVSWQEYSFIIEELIRLRMRTNCDQERAETGDLIFSFCCRSK